MKKALLIIAINLVLIAVWLVGRNSSKNLITQNIQLVVDEHVTQTEIEEVREAFDALPSFIITRFVEEDWKVVVLSQETVAEEDLEPFNNNKTAGTINFTKKTITLRSFAPLEGAVKNVMLHELGHFVDWMSNNLSDTDDFVKLYEQFKDGKYVTFNYDGITVDDNTREDILYATSSTKEFFAEGIKDYFIHKEWLMDNYPDVYIFYNTYIKESVFGQNLELE